MINPLVLRIEKLERQNKRMRVIVSGLCLSLGGLLTMGSVLPQKGAARMERIEAREIVLSDRGMSAKLTPQSLSFSAGSGSESEKAAISASEFSLGGRYSTVIRPEGILCSREGVPRFDLAVREIGASIGFKNADGHMGSMLDESTLILMDEKSMASMRPEHVFIQKGEADTLLTSSALKIRDEARHKAILGHSDLGKAGKGDARAGSAASLMLLGNDDTVVWQAP